MSIGFVYKDDQKVLKETIVNGIPVLQFPILENTGLVQHGFSTRLGGVSDGVCSTMNLSFARGDDEKSVRENYKRIASAIGVKEDSFVFSAQTHTTNVRVITDEDKGKGLQKPIDYTDVDGLITNTPGLCLVTFYADCVPLFFLDPIKRVIGLSHSGWRGTVNKMAKKTIEKMQEIYHCDPTDMIVAVGPSICQQCYEVSEEVVNAFKEQFLEKYWDLLFYQKENSKYQLNLWKANEIVLNESGILRKNMAVTNLCTCCNSKLLFSHRASNGKRGNLAAFLALK